MPPNVDHHHRARGNWFTLTSAFMVVIRAVGKACQGIFRHQQLQHYFPTITYLTTHDLTNTDMERSSPASCEHPPDQLRKYGNPSGRFHECKGCGAKWRCTTFVHESTQHEMTIKDEEFVPRGRPWGARGPPPRTSASSSTSQASSVPRSPARPSSTPVTTARPGLLLQARPISSSEYTFVDDHSSLDLES